MLSSLKRLFGGKPAYEIVQSATGTAAGDKPAVLLSVALHTRSGQEAMVTALVLHRYAMLSLAIVFPR